MKVFISHSSKDSAIANELARLMESAAPGTEVFCSSIRTGQDFVRAITRAMEQCDAFVPLLTPHYYASRFCMVELGFAYAVLTRDYPDGEGYIFPAVIPPVKVGEALMDTPLAELQACAIHEPGELRDFLETVLENGELVGKAALKRMAAAFVHSLRLRLCEKENLAAGAQCLVCKGNVPGTDGDYLDYSVTPGGTGYVVNFRARPFGGEYPDFLSFVFKYVDPLDLYDAAVLLNDACLTADIHSYTDSLRAIQVEVKYSDAQRVLERRRFPLRAGDNRIEIPLRDMLYEKLKQICEICFVIPQDAYVEDEGMFRIERLRIERGC